MAQVILKGASLFCGLGGPYVAPFIAPLINPVGWSMLMLCCFLPILTMPVSFLNSTNGIKQDSKRSFTSAFLIYYIICIILMFILLNMACNVNNQINPF